MENKKYHCDCDTKCKGRQREVSKATYFRHMPYRNHLSKYSRSMQKFLKDNPVIVATSSSRATQSSRLRVAGPSDENTDRTIGPPNKRARGSADDSGRAVGTSFW